MPLYQHGKRTPQARNTKSFFGVAVVVGISIVVAAYIISKDIGNTTSPKTNVPIVTNIGEDEDAKLTVNEKLFMFKLPSDWKLESKINDENVHRYIWGSTKKGADDRRLSLYIDTMPVEQKLVRMQPLIPSDKKFILGNISGDCVGFAGLNRKDPKDTTPFPAKWENVNFLCDPITINQTVGTGSVNGGIATTLSGGQGRHKYFFFYEDHNVRPDDRILQDALKSFEAK